MDDPTQAEIMETLTGIFREVLDNPSLVLREDLTAAEVENWDSLSHIDLIVAAEHKFKTKFTTREVVSLKNVGDLAALVRTKVAAHH
ncbi:MAG: acyl carrier protein [Terriglobia bacterium]